MSSGKWADLVQVDSKKVADLSGVEGAPCERVGIEREGYRDYWRRQTSSYESQNEEWFFVWVEHHGCSQQGGGPQKVVCATPVCLSCSQQHQHRDRCDANDFVFLPVAACDEELQRYQHESQFDAIIRQAIAQKIKQPILSLRRRRHRSKRPCTRGVRYDGPDDEWTHKAN